MDHFSDTSHFNAALVEDDNRTETRWSEIMDELISDNCWIWMRTLVFPHVDQLIWAGWMKFVKQMAIEHPVTSSHRSNSCWLSAVRADFVFHAVTNSFLPIFVAHNSRRNVFRCQIDAFATADCATSSLPTRKVACLARVIAV